RCACANLTNRLIGGADGALARRHRMSRNKDLPAELDELAHMLDDPQVSEFLLFYLRIRDPHARAHLRRALAEMALSLDTRSGRLKDVARRQRLKLAQHPRRPKLES